MTVTPPAPPARRRSRIRLSVRGLTILVLVLGAGLAWVIRPARMQRDAVTAIQRLGGNVNIRPLAGGTLDRRSVPTPWENTGTRLVPKQA